jgi:hypothetical protein
MIQDLQAAEAGPMTSINFWEPIKGLVEAANTESDKSVNSNVEI